MASLSSQLSQGQCTELVNRLGRFGVDPTKVRTMLGNDDALKWWVKQLGEHPAFKLVHGIWRPTADQLGVWQDWNSEFGLGIPEAQFEAAARLPIPEFTSDPSVCVTLVWYGNNTYRTFWMLWKIARAQQKRSYHLEVYENSKNVRLLTGVEQPKRGFRWERINTGCNRDRKPQDVRDPKTSPHAGIIASAAMHPDWVRAMDGDKVPYVYMAGYEVNDPSDNTPWRRVPGAGFSRGDNCEVWLSHGSCNDHDRECAVPSFA